jgi:general secretion pathway protein C
VNALFWILAAGLSISIGLAAVPVIWHGLGEFGAPAPGFTALAAPAPAAQTLDAILAFAPFGSAAPVAVPDAALPEAALGLTLLGLTVAVPTTASRAMIAGGDTPVASYGIGSAINANVTLAEVFSDHVILLVGGQPQTLAFVTGTAQAGVTGFATDQVAIDPAQDADAAVARYRAEILQDPQGVMDRLGLRATPNGYQIATTAPPAVMQAGFQPGDLVTTVNGQRVGDVAQDQQYIDQIVATGRATVEVQRDGQTIIMTFPLR